MKGLWRERLIDAIKRSGKSWRSISIAANLSPNFVTQMIRDGKTPSTDNLVSLASALGISMTFLFTGSYLSAEDEEVLRLYSLLPAEEREHLFGMLRARASSAPKT
ncbi:MAG TPA: helix-turn-helix domain-containing protein [Devosiaceae bacterium]